MVWDDDGSAVAFAANFNDDEAATLGRRAGARDATLLQEAGADGRYPEGTVGGWRCASNDTSLHKWEPLGGLFRSTMQGGGDPIIWRDPRNSRWYGCVASLTHAGYEDMFSTSSLSGEWTREVTDRVSRYIQYRCCHYGIATCHRMPSYAEATGAEPRVTLHAIACRYIPIHTVALTSRIDGIYRAVPLQTNPLFTSNRSVLVSGHPQKEAFITPDYFPLPRRPNATGARRCVTVCNGV